jgi:PHD-finger
VEKAELSLSTGHGAEWPDKEYPWSVQELQRDEYEKAWRRQRLAWIERFFDRESESEDEEKQCVAGPSTWSQPIDLGSSTRLHRGHGQPISVNAPHSKGSRGARQMSFNTANTDAREVLLSKKHVRTVVERIRKRKIAEEEDGVVMCICQGADDGRPMVRCDECRTWYHLICMDIRDESELGDEWFCWKCLPSAGDPSHVPHIEPTFAPARPDSPARAGVGDQPLYQSTLQPSPMPASPIARRQQDRSPTRRSRLPHSLGDSGDPVRGGPSTPYLARTADSRLYSPPKLYDEYRTDEHVPFDPTSTPSRGLKFPNPVPTTPRRQHPWTPAPSLSWSTHGPPRTPLFFSQSGSSSTRSLAHSLSTLEDSVGPLSSPWPADDSPTRKPPRGTDPAWPYPTPRRVLDSPLVVQSADRRPFPLGVEESPIPRLFYGLKDTESRHSPHHD